MARSLNKVELIGNLTRDPELRYTPSGTAVCTFGLATNRQWTIDSGEKREEVEFHRIVAWNKLAELCAQLLTKGRKVYVEGRLQTRKWAGQDGAQRVTTEIVISDMIILDSRGATEATSTDTSASLEEFDVPDEDITADMPAGQGEEVEKGALKTGVKKDDTEKTGQVKSKTVKKADPIDSEKAESEDEDIPF